MAHGRPSSKRCWRCAFCSSCWAPASSAAIATWIYRLTDLFLFPFQGLSANPTVGATVFEITTAIAMLVYAVAAWAFVTLLNVLFARSYTTTSSTHRHISTDSQ